MARNRRRWNNLFRVEADFKRRQIARVLGFAGVYVALSSLVLGFFYAHVLHPGLVGSRPFYLDLSSSGELWRQIPGLRGTVTVFATAMTGLSSLFAVAIGLHFSHKMAGPIYRFKQELARLQEGREIRPIALRKGDDFQDVAASLNGALETLRAREETLRGQLESAEEHDALRQTLLAVRARLDRDEAAGAGRDAAALVRDLRQLLGKLD